jgi:NADH-quinone oxidoreductase subunit H
MLAVAVEALLKSAVVLAGVMTAAAYLVLVERWFAAWVQGRLGPNRVGIPLTRIRLFGLGQPMADGLKFIFKEEFTPSHVDKFLFFVAPVVIFVGAIGAFAVIPFGDVLPIALGAAGRTEPLRLILAPGLDVGTVYLSAVGGIAVYGVILGGWASNNKYGFFGGVRASAQLLAYEVPLGLGLVGVVMAAGSMRLDAIIAQQAASGIWNALVQPLGFMVFCVAATAEAGRLPFDLSECEQELVGGYHTEYSGIKLMMYLVADFLHMIAAAFLIVILYLGGWHLWGLPAGAEVTWPIALLRIGVLLAKVLGVILFFMLIRWSWPRFRFDQLMGLAWNVMLPLGLVNLVMIAVWVEYGPALAQTLRVPVWAAAAGVGWLVLVVAWLIVTLAVPVSSDNRPRREEEVVRNEFDEALLP